MHKAWSAISRLDPPLQHASFARPAAPPPSKHHRRCDACQSPSHQPYADHRACSGMRAVVAMLQALQIRRRQNVDLRQSDRQRITGRKRLLYSMIEGRLRVRGIGRRSQRRSSAFRRRTRMAFRCRKGKGIRAAGVHGRTSSRDDDGWMNGWRRAEGRLASRFDGGLTARGNPQCHRRLPPPFAVQALSAACAALRDLFRPMPGWDDPGPCAAYRPGSRPGSPWLYLRHVGHCHLAGLRSCGDARRGRYRVDGA